MLRPRTQSSATVPGGSDTQVQFNNAGAFGGSPYFMLDTVSNIFQYDTGNVAVRVSDAGQATLIAGEVVLERAETSQRRVGGVAPVLIPMGRTAVRRHAEDVADRLGEVAADAQNGFVEGFC